MGMLFHCCLLLLLLLLLLVACAVVANGQMQGDFPPGIL
jgi:hypothetical protein